MTSVAPDKSAGRWIEHAIAAGVFALICSVLGYYELFDHRSITDDGLFGGLAHATLFASLTLYALGMARFAKPALICAVLAIGAGVIELFEIVPTAPGTPLNWISSLAGIGACGIGVHLKGRPRRDTALAMAVILWGCGVICSLQAPTGAPPSAEAVAPD